MQVVLELLRTGLCLRAITRSTPEMLSSKIFSTISAYLCSCSYQHCYHIKQR